MLRTGKPFSLHRLLDPAVFFCTRNHQNDWGAQKTVISYLTLIFFQKLKQNGLIYIKIINSMSHLIDNSDTDSNTTIVPPFNRFHADFSHDFENEFETQIRNETENSAHYKKN